MGSKVIFKTISCILLICILMTAGCGKMGGYEHNTDYVRAKKLIDSFSENISESDYDSIEFDALGHYALAYLYMYKSTGEKEYLRYSQSILGYLIEKGDNDNDGYTGWGLRFEYDAFSDGTINDINTEYTYTTSVIGFAMCEAYNVTKDNLYLESIKQIRSTFLDHIGYSETEKGICFWYSSSSNDHIYSVHNVNVYTLQFLADYDDIFDIDIMSDGIINKIRQFEEETMVSSGKWLYCEERDSKNDLVHWGFSATTYYRLYELTNDKIYLNLAEESLNAIKQDYFVNYDIMDDSSHLWGIPEILIALSYEKKYSNGKDLDSVLSNIDKDLDDEGRFIPALGKVCYVSDTFENYRAMSWYTYAFSFIYYTSV